MKEPKANRDLDFEALRHAIEQCDLNLLPGFYAEDAQLSIVNADAPHALPFELCGKAEINKHLQVVFSEETSHHVEREVVSEGRVTFWETSEYPDGSRVLVETTLEVRNGKIFRQVDGVAKEAQADGEVEIDQGLPNRHTHPETRPEMEAPLPDRLLRFKQAAEKEELR